MASVTEYVLHDTVELPPHKVVIEYHRTTDSHKLTLRYADAEGSHSLVAFESIERVDWGDLGVLTTMLKHRITDPAELEQLFDKVVLAIAEMSTKNHFIPAPNFMVDRSERETM